MKTIPVAEPDLTGNEVKYVVDAIENERRISSSGKYVSRFEMECASHFGRAFAVSCSNGTAALHLAIMSLGIGKGDEVIVPTFTFAATAAAVVHAGATPVYVDVDEKTWNIDVSKLDAIKTSKTKAIIAVDIYGVCAEYRQLEAWCTTNKVLLIEDAAEAHGSVYDNRPSGSFGDVATFSFFGNKVLTTGEGGVLVCDNEKIEKSARVYKNHGMASAGIYDNDVVGYNYRITNVQAAIGCAQFERFEEFLEKRRAHAVLYEKLLSHSRISFQKYDKAMQTPTSWLFSMRINNANIAEVRRKLLEEGIETRTLFKPLHLHKAYAPFVKDGQTFPIAEAIWGEGISLPSSSLLSKEDIEYVAEKLLQIIS